MQRKSISIAWHPAALAATYILVKYQEVRRVISGAEMALTLLVAVALVGGIHFLLARGFRDQRRAGVLLSAALLAYCFYPPAHLWMNDHWPASWGGHWVKLRIALPGLALALAALGWALRRATGSLAELTAWLNVTTLATAMASAGQLAWLAWQQPAPTTLTAVTPPALPAPKPARAPDIIFLILDSYTSAKSLKQWWNFDNEEFLGFLEGKGFQVLRDARSNYRSTPFCLGSSLNLAYLRDLRGSRSERCTALSASIKDSLVARALKQYGYQIVNLSLFDFGEEKQYYRHEEFDARPFFHHLQQQSLWGLAKNAVSSRRMARVNLALMAELERQVSGGRQATPRFIYAHLMMPHPPFLFDRHGQPVNRGFRLPMDRRDYLEQLLYANQLVRRAIETTLQAYREPPVIIIQGDHGFRYLPDDPDRVEAHSILNAFLLPGRPDARIPAGLTPVNTFRFLFNEYFGTSYPLLENIVNPGPTASQTTDEH
jgi:hypothetical protein